jgi:hypothetical protein
MSWVGRRGTAYATSVSNCAGWRTAERGSVRDAGLYVCVPILRFKIHVRISPDFLFVNKRHKLTKEPLSTIPGFIKK